MNYSLCTDRDWFRINPLEMVLLGCQSLSSNAPAKRDVSCLVGHILSTVQYYCVLALGA